MKIGDTSNIERLPPYMRFLTNVGILFIPLWATLCGSAVSNQPGNVVPRSTTQEVALGMNKMAIPKGFRIVRGKNTFLRFLTRSLFADKTTFINEILTCNTTVLVFNFPNRWGKTLNLDMLKTFVEMEVRAFGIDIIPPTGLEKYKLFTEGKYRLEEVKIDLEKPLLISNKKYARLIEKHLGQYPVIEILFPFGISLIPDGKKALRKLKEMIAKVFETHSYMLSVYENVILGADVQEYEKTKAENDKALFQIYLAFGTNNSTEEEDKILTKSLRFLSEQLGRHFNRKVFVFMDEFDELLRSNIAGVFADLLTNTVNDNKYLEKAVFMGMLPMVMEGNSSFKDVAYINFMSVSWNRYFGLIKKEATLAHRYYETTIKERKKIEYWYGGYQVGKNKDPMLNLWSVRGFFINRVYFPYWVKTFFLGNIPIHDIFQIPGFSYVFSLLATGKNFNITFENIAMHRNELDTIRNKYLENQPSNIFNALKYMFLSGFLTMKNTSFDRQNNLHTVSLKFPNHEVVSYLQKVFTHNMNRTFDSNVMELLETSSLLWKNFTTNDDTASPELENQMNKCFHSLPLPTIPKKLEHEESIFYSFIMSMVGSRQFEFSFLNSEISDILFLYQSRAVVVQIRYEENTATLETDHSSQYLNSVFDEFELCWDIKDLKIIKCNVRQDKSVQITSTLHPKPSRKEIKETSDQSEFCANETLQS